MVLSVSPPPPPYILHASAIVCLFSAISFRSFTISLRISSSSFFAFRAFLLSSSCIWSLASHRMAFLRAFSCLWSSNAFWRLSRFSFTWGGGGRWQESKQVRRAQEFELQCESTGWEARNPICSWQWLNWLFWDHQKTQFKRVVLNQHYLIGAYSKVTAVLASPVSLQKGGKPE